MVQKREITNEGAPPVRFQISKGEEQSSSAPESCGGPQRRSTASWEDRRVPTCSGCPSASVGGGGGRRRAPHRRRSLLRRTAARVEMDLIGDGCEGLIEAWVSSLVARGGC